ncbi:MAG: 16S rRNA (adenine(1518)-N(6)/adenine(1519)-N(6))-dimethyltransferase RsmA [Gemmatimonadales bacterium]
MKRRYARPKKRLGQNFLYDPAIAERIVSAADLAAGDVVVELGPGRGILTRALAARDVRLIALELDSALQETLAEEFGAAVEVINADFTGVSIHNLLQDRGLRRCTLMGNIPYHLTREVLFGFLVDEFESLEGAVIMVQREVGERIVSPPGSRVYGITSVVLQSLYAVDVVARVAPGSFQPPPKVASSVLRFQPLADPLPGAERAEFVALVKNVFQQRRKTLQNTLRAFYSLSNQRLAAVAADAGIDLGARPEALGKEEFHRLARSLAKESKQ